MDPSDQDALRAHMHRRHLPRGDILARANDPVDVVYFPETADIANVVTLGGGKAGMATTVGRDGLTGLAAFLAEEPLGWDIQVLIEGVGWSLAADTLRARTEVSPALRRLLLQLTHNNQIEASRNAVCNQNHQTLPRVARWLLTTQDRTGVSELAFTQDELAGLLGVRRTTMVETVQALVERKAIRHRRGRLLITDRAALKSAACDCYAVTAGLLGAHD